MKRVFPKLALTTALSTAIATISLPSQAATVFWDLEFFDESSGGLVGTGEFSYDGSEPFEGTIPTPVPDIPEFPDITIRKSDNWYELETFSATILDVTWNLSDGRWTAIIDGQVEEFFPYAALFAWQPPQTDTYPGSGGGPRSVDAYPRSVPGYFKSEDWSIGDLAFDPFLGIFSESFFQFTEPGPLPGGTWTATRRVRDIKTTPEPSTVLGLALALGIGASLRKRRVSRTERG